MIQCPLCQMINDDQTRFCAECGARLGPAPGGPPAQAPPGPPGAKLSSPMLGSGQENIEVDRLRKMSNQDQNQSRPPEKPAKKLRSPLLASDEDDFDEPPAPQRGRGAQGQSRQHLHSPLLGDGGEDDFVTPQHTGGRGGPLHSPLLGDAGSHGVHHDSNSPSGKHLNSPLLGDAGAHGDTPPPQAGSGKHHLHSPLLGGGDDDGDYYDEPAPRKGGLHSPILGGGGGGAQTGGRSGLRSPMFAAAGGGGGQDYYDEYEEDPYADEDNPNILRSPLLSSKMNEAPGAGRAPKPKPQQPPGMAQGQQGMHGQPAMHAPANQPANYPQHQPPSHQAMATAHPAQQAGAAFQPDANLATLPPGNQMQVPQGPAGGAPPMPGMGAQHPQMPQQPQGSMQQQPMMPQQQGMPHPGQAMGGHPQGMPGQAPMNPQQMHQQQMQPQAPQQPMQGSPAPAAPSMPPAKPAMPPASPPSQFNVVQNQTPDEDFPDMTRYRRGDAADSSSSQSQSPVLPVSMPLAAGIPDPASFVPPEEKQAQTPAAASFVPKQAVSAPPPAPFAEAPAPEPAAKEAIKSTSKPASKPKLHSKLLADDAADDDFDSPFPSKGSSLPNRNQNSYASPSAPASPIPKVMGGVAVFMALLKLPMLMTYLPAISNPQYTWTAVDLLATTVALIALGLAAIMSRN